MPCRWCELLILGSLTAAGRVVAQEGAELGLQAIGTLSDPGTGVGAAYAAVRTGTRTRVSLSLGPGLADGNWIGRGELLGHFLLSPEQQRSAGFYFAGGIAGVTGAVSRGYLVLTAGIEKGPAGRSGWAFEAGIGGGFRLAAGYRWRWPSGRTGQ
jgi:hypothetical protein